MTTCAPSSGGLCADARNFSFPMKKAYRTVLCWIEDGSAGGFTVGSRWFAKPATAANNEE
jgi:hypothetical protein